MQQTTTIKYFAYSHLPEHLQAVSKPIGDLANMLEANLPNGPEKSAGMRKLLEAKDCFVRAALDAPGGGLLVEQKTPLQVEASIAEEHYFTAWQGAQLAYWSESSPFNLKPEEGEPDRDGPLGLLMLCILVLCDGRVAIGEHACAGPEYFQYGRERARANAISKIATYADTVNKNVT